MRGVQVDPNAIWWKICSSRRAGWRAHRARAGPHLNCLEQQWLAALECLLSAGQGQEPLDHSLLLLVGAVGVANIMVISVLERRSEIGLRRALGATRGQIRTQFLSEVILLPIGAGLAFALPLLENQWGNQDAPFASRGTGQRSLGWMCFGD